MSFYNSLECCDFVAKFQRIFLVNNEFSAVEFCFTNVNSPVPAVDEQIYLRTVNVFIVNIANIDKSSFEFLCSECNKPLKLTGKWSTHNCGFFANMVCDNCKKKYIASVRIRKLFDSVKVRRKLFEKKKKDDSADVQTVIPNID